MKGKIGTACQNKERKLLSETLHKPKKGWAKMVARAEQLEEMRRNKLRKEISYG